MIKQNAKWIGPLKQVKEYEWHIPKDQHPGMLVDGVVYGDHQLIQAVLHDKAWEQVINVAKLPGIVGQAMAMPDIHWGFGFPIGGVAAFSVDNGIVSPGGVGYDINCGVRLIRSDLEKSDVLPRINALITSLYQHIPAGVGSESNLRLNTADLHRVMKQGSQWAIEQGYGWNEDLENTESQGCLTSTDIQQVSSRALERGAPQLGTLGSGNHFLEIQAVDEIYDEQAAQVLGLYKNQITILIHCGSRGLGYQVCDDFARSFKQVSARYGIELPDPQLACGPIQSPEGQAYLTAMACAANYAWANRQCINHEVRSCFETIFQSPAERLGLRLVYDVSHNIAKLETHKVGDQELLVCVHRKGATRSFPAHHPDLPSAYQSIGQPVLIPGSMGTASYVCCGTTVAMDKTFGSTAHGAGRKLSRHAALKQTRGRSIFNELSKAGISVMARGKKTLAEEAPEAYKDIDQVIASVDGAGLSKKVARLVPLAVVKG